jgi:hypothetical protein
MLADIQSSCWGKRDTYRDVTLRDMNVSTPWKGFPLIYFTRVIWNVENFFRVYLLQYIYIKPDINDTDHLKLCKLFYNFTGLYSELLKRFLSYVTYWPGDFIENQTFKVIMYSELEYFVVVYFRTLTQHFLRGGGGGGKLKLRPHKYELLWQNIVLTFR